MMHGTTNIKLLCSVTTTRLWAGYAENRFISSPKHPD